jgi:hypothetical protein
LKHYWRLCCIPPCIGSDRQPEFSHPAFDFSQHHEIANRLAVFVLPLLYLTATLLYSAHMAVWGRQVDPESAYTMNGLVTAAGYPSMKHDHPGTTTTLLVEIVIRLWAHVARPTDIVQFGLEHYDSITYAARTCEALILTGVLVAGGLIVRNAAQSTLAAMLFQVGPFVNADTFHYEMVLVPESLMVSCALLGMGLAIKVAFNENPPTVRRGVALGLIFALGFSSKYLYLPLALIGVCLLRNSRALVAACITGTLGFAAFNLIFNPGAITRGFGWLWQIATHKGIYGQGEAGFVDPDLFWFDMGSIITAAPLVFAVFVVAGIISSVDVIRNWRKPDPASLTLFATSVAFLLQLVATSKHFALHYMMGTWVLVGGVLVLLTLRLKRLAPSIPPDLFAGVGFIACALAISTMLMWVRQETLEWMALDDLGAKLSKAVIAAGPSCANVSSMFVRAPENDLNHGFGMTVEPWGDRSTKDRFSDAYARAFTAPLLDHDVYTHLLHKNFRPTTYAKLATEYPCIVVRTFVELDASTANGLLELNPDHCVVADIHVYTVGIACENIRRAFQDI